MRPGGDDVKRAIALGLAVLWAAGAGTTGFEVYVFNGSGAAAQPWYPYHAGMRCQMLFDRDKIDRAGEITEFELEKSVHVATFVNVKFYMCHTPLGALTPTFAANYGGRTPKLVASFASYELPNVGGVYPIPMAEAFDYNNRDNLLLEVTWESGTGAKVFLLAGSVAAHQVYEYDDEAASGTVQDLAYNALVHFDQYPGVAPASFGRVKALFR
jgi:hypothetical protein